MEVNLLLVWLVLIVFLFEIFGEIKLIFSFFGIGSIPGFFDSGFPNKLVLVVILLSSFLPKVIELLLGFAIVSSSFFLISFSFFIWVSFVIPKLIPLLSFWNKFLLISFLSPGDLNKLLSPSFFSFLFAEPDKSNLNNPPWFEFIGLLEPSLSLLLLEDSNKFFLGFDPNKVFWTLFSWLDFCSLVPVGLNMLPNKEGFSLLNKDELIFVFCSSFSVLVWKAPNKVGWFCLEISWPKIDDI